MSNIDFSRKIHAQRPFGKDAATKESTSKKTPQQLQRSFESDRGRIINSAAIRRLQQKTQVFPLEKNAAVRSRLTHSMEVQQVGRYIVQSIFSKLSDAQLNKFGLIGLERCIESLVEMSCLMHDIGNPPFGHFGEQAINQWFISHLEDLALVRTKEGTQFNLFQDSPELARDIQQFEGNAQAIRLIHCVLNLNLTYSQAAGILKYTRPATLEKSAVSADKSYLMKKVGYYFSEKSFIEDMSSSLELEQGCRFPLSYIMEAADDISYCLADIEDAVEKGILSTARLSQLLEQTYIDVLKHKFKIDDSSAIARMNKCLKDAQQSSNFFISLRVSLSHPLVKHATQQFIQNIDQVYQGSYNNALLEDNSCFHAIIETLKKVAINYVFCHPEVEKLELQGYRIISGLLDCYKPLLAMPHKLFALTLANKKEAPLIAKHLAKKLPARHVSTYSEAIRKLKRDQADFLGLEFYHRCRLIQDYISGMTDQFAYDEYRMMMVID
ncbi:MAG: dGTPase [Oceanospirillaceae bacterium]|jgi:dGTPase